MQAKILPSKNYSNHTLHSTCQSTLKLRKKVTNSHCSKINFNGLSYIHNV